MGPTEFGEKLRLERAGRQTTIEEIAVQSRVDQRYLEALERGDFAALPGRAIGKFYVRLYAEILGFEPDEWLARYDRAQQLSRRPSLKSPGSSGKPPRPVEAAIARWRATLAAERDDQIEEASPPDPDPDPDPDPEVEPSPPVVPEASVDPETVEPEPGPVRAPLAPNRPRWVAVVALLAITAGVWLGGTALFDRAPSVDRSRPVARIAELPVPSRAPARVTEPPGAIEPRETVNARAPSDPVPVPGALTVPEFGTGRAVENYRLVDPSDRFEEGSAVYFLTRVLGGSRGERIRHVWLRDGRTVQSIELSLGAGHWRTHSRKTLWGTGQWSVEARDLDDRVLARAEFTCVPKR